MKAETVMYIAAGVGAFILINSLTKGKAATATGEAIGSAILAIPQGAVIGTLESLQNAQSWAQQQESVPVIDWIASPLGTAYGNISTFMQATDKTAWLKRVTGI